MTLDPLSDPGLPALREGACPVCGLAAVTPLLEMAQVPVLANVLWSTPEAAVQAPKGDIRLAFCPRCGHVFNQAFDPALLDYDPAYENSLHFSPRFQQYAEGLATRLVAQYDLRGKTIVEIGSGKGDFLQMLCAFGDNHGTGFDPSHDPALCGTASDRVHFVQDFYSERYADQPADLICCRHVLEHVPDPRGFVQMVRRAIGSWETVVYFEVPNVAYTLRDLGIWDLIYEHYSYFSLHSLAYLFTACGFAIRRITETYEGQFLGIEAIPGENLSGTAWEPWADLAEIAGHAAAFADRYRSKVIAWQQILTGIEQAGRRAVIWGGGSKGVTFLNTLHVSPGQIAYGVDINPRKQGRWVAGTGQQLVAPDFLARYQPDVIIVMNPIYLDEIRQHAEEMGLNCEFKLV